MKERIIEVFKKVFEVEVVDEEMSTQKCEKWDSLGHLNLVVALEEEFNVGFEPEEIAEMINVGKIQQIVEEKIMK
jgi:acyl carrier protein